MRVKLAPAGTLKSNNCPLQIKIKGKEPINTMCLGGRLYVRLRPQLLPQRPACWSKLLLIDTHRLAYYNDTGNNDTGQRHDVDKRPYEITIVCYYTPVSNIVMMFIFGTVWVV